MDRDPFSMQGKMAVVTGAARGLGRAAAVGLATSGADVALIDLEAARCDEAAREITALGRWGAAYGCDVSDPKAGRPLLLWGEFSPDDWQLIHRELGPLRLSL